MALQMSLTSFNIFTSVLPKKSTISNISDKRYVERGLELVKEKRANLIANMEEKEIIEKYDNTIIEIQNYLKTL